MKKLLILVMATVLIFSIIGCSGDGDKENVSIRGQITKVTVGNDKGIKSILVEGKLEQDTEFDKASVSIDSKTLIFKGDKDTKVPVSELKEGMNVEVVITGPVRESYPVQVSAKVIRIIQ